MKVFDSMKSNYQATSFLNDQVGQGIFHETKHYRLENEALFITGISNSNSKHLLDEKC